MLKAAEQTKDRQYELLKAAEQTKDRQYELLKAAGQTKDKRHDSVLEANPTAFSPPNNQYELWPGTAAERNAESP